MAPRIILPTDPDKREWALRAQLKGKTLLGEVSFDQKQCDITARFFAGVVARRGADPGRRLIVEAWPVMYALWLANEAFFNFVGAKYWPFVLDKLNITNHNAYSSRFGSSFLEVLDSFQLPRFKRLKTRWSYLGPILAHAGIPQSCIPEYFEKVVPKAIELGASSRAGFESLQGALPSLYLPRATEWFILFGDAVAEDFVRRSVDLFRAKSDGQDVAPHAERLPRRVVEAFETWWASEPAVRRATASGPKVRRPVLTFDPLEGLRLTLPSQTCDLGQSGVVWRLQLDRSIPVDFQAQRLPGQLQTEPRETTFSEPFGVLTIRLLESGNEKGLWTFGGVTQDHPVLFFEPEFGRVLHRANLDASLLGVVHPSGTHLVGFKDDERSRPRVVSSIGQLRFGWRSFDASLIDCSGSDQLAVRSTNGDQVWRGELRDIGAIPPRLSPLSGKATRSREGLLVFAGAAPVLTITPRPNEGKDQTLAAWSVRVRPIHDEAAPADIVQLRLDNPDLLIDSDEAGSLRLPLGQRDLLGTRPWGVFEVSALGPIGRDASFRFVVRPDVHVTHDWTGWKQKENLHAQIQVPLGARLVGATATADPQVFFKETSGHPLNLTLVAIGFGGYEWQLPLDLGVAIPSWSLYEPANHQPLLEWSSKPLRVSLAELDGRAVSLLLRAATPVGIPEAADLILRSASGVLAHQPIDLDDQGYCAIDLLPFLSTARQSQAARVDLEVALRLGSHRVALRAAQLEREWQPEGLVATVDKTSVILTWEERFSVEGRAVHVKNLLQPWKDPVAVSLAPTDRGRISIARDGFEAGCYRLAVGLQDDWTGRFQEQGSVDVEIGELRDWREHPLASAPSGDGMLYRLLLAHRAERAGISIETRSDDRIDAESGSAEKVLRACLAVGTGRQSDVVANRLGRLLLQVPLEETLGAIAAMEGTITPEVILRLRLFNRHTAMSGSAVDPLIMEALWRIWSPLGAWAELRCLEAGDREAEKRLEHIVGAESLQALSPVTNGGRVRLFGILPDEPLKCRVTDILPGSGQGPFSIRRLESPAVLMVETQSLGDANTPLALSHGSQGWALQAVGDATLPEPLASAAAAEQNNLLVAIYYPRRPGACRGAPESQIISVIKIGHADIVRAWLEHCSPLPSGPIGGDAFIAACFDWAVRAGSDRQILMRLTDMCAGVAMPRAREASAKLREGALDKSEASDRIVAELLARGDHRVELEPLLAMHQLTWMTAMALIWRGLGRPLPFMWSEADMVGTALALNECAPRLLEHDLVKICAIESLAAARWSGKLGDQSESGEHDAA
jgi:hypothetical protein